jgi:hypothetical protein
MIRKNIRLNYGLAAASIAASLLAAPATAGTSWTDLTAGTVGTPGSASGTVNGVTVTYTGEVLSAVTDGTSIVWTPESSFIGGTVTASPNSVGDAIFLNGSYTGTNTITFGAPVTNPVFAIWSLGGPALTATFTFSAPPTFEAGGPNSFYGGQAITVSGNTVSGNEGNGVVQFTGTYSTLSWTDTAENYYGFTTGLAGAPEPSQFLGLGLGALCLGGLILKARRRHAV